jgi:DNA-binding MarR family transcriptional regulator
MEQRGLVARANSADDGRGATVTLTETGRRALHEAAPKHVESVRAHFVDLLTPAEIEALADIATKVVDHLSD